MDEQILSFKDSLRVVLRYRRVAAAFALVGLLVGVAYVVAVPALTSAKSQVLLPGPAINTSGLPTRDIQTEVQIAMSPGILDPAAKIAGVSLPYTTLVHQVTITGITDSLLQIVAKSSSASQAERLANAVAAEFISYATSESSSIASSTVTELNGQAAQYQQQINVLNQEIANTKNAVESLAPGSNDATSDTALLATETNALNNTLQQVKLVKSQINQAQLSGSSSKSGAVLLESATTANPPSVLRIPMFGVIGLLIGLLIGIVVAFGVGRKDRRLRERDEIARAAGAPVLASLTAVRRHKSEEMIGLLDHFEPSVIDKANLRRLLDELGVERRYDRVEAPRSQNGSSAHHENGSSVQQESIGVHAIVLAGDDGAVAAAAELPAFAASLGLPVALVVAGSNSSTQQLAIACAARDPLALDAPRPNLLTYATAPGKAPGGVVLAVTLEVVDPATLDVADIEPTPGVQGRHEEALLIVSSGFAKAEDLEVVALAAEHHGHPLVGVIVAGPEPSDKTSGLQQPRRVMGPNGPRQLSALRSANR